MFNLGLQQNLFKLKLNQAFVESNFKKNLNMIKFVSFKV